MDRGGRWVQKWTPWGVEVNTRFPLMRINSFPVSAFNYAAVRSERPSPSPAHDFATPARTVYHVPQNSTCWRQQGFWEVEFGTRGDRDGVVFSSANSGATSKFRRLWLVSFYACSQRIVFSIIVHSGSNSCSWWAPPPLALPNRPINNGQAMR